MALPKTAKKTAPKTKAGKALADFLKSEKAPPPVVKSVGLPADGKLGPQTLALLKKYHDLSAKLSAKWPVAQREKAEALAVKAISAGHDLSLALSRMASQTSGTKGLKGIQSSKIDALRTKAEAAWKDFEAQDVRKYDKMVDAVRSAHREVVRSFRAEHLDSVEGESLGL